MILQGYIEYPCVPDFLGDVLLLSGEPILQHWIHKWCRILWQKQWQTSHVFLLKRLSWKLTLKKIIHHMNCYTSLSSNRVHQQKKNSNHWTIPIFWYWDDMNQPWFSLPLWRLGTCQKSPDRIVLDLRIAPLWCKSQGGFALRGHSEVENKGPGRWVASEISKTICHVPLNPWFLGKKKLCNQSWFILFVQKTHTFFHTVERVFISKQPPVLKRLFFVEFTRSKSGIRKTLHFAASSQRSNWRKHTHH